MSKRSAFIGRQSELAALNRIWEDDDAAMLILYGRRRVGKTRLLTHWLSELPGRGLYWVAEPTSSHQQLRSFSQAIYNFRHNNSAPRDFTYADWEQAFEELAAIAANERIAFIIDEVTYLIEVESGFAGMLQKVWDHTLKDTQLKLALSGSQMALMQRDMVAYDGPLYGRAKALIRLAPMPYTATKEYFPQYDVFDRVMLYSIFGGIPAYWERVKQSSSVIENVRNELLTANNLMQEEARILLQDFITDTSNYVGIMRAIANGSQTQAEISRHTGLTQGHVSKNLSILRGTSFVERQVPVTEAPEKSRRGHYHVSDPYLRFYFRFMAPYLRQILLGEQDEPLSDIELKMPEFIEKNTWTELCRDWVAIASIRNQLPVSVESVGGAWTRSTAVDVVGIDYATRRLILGACHWNGRPMRARVLRDLIKRTASIVPKQGEWEVYYIAFGAHGWDDELAALVDDLSESKGGRNWQVIGGELVDVARVDGDLSQWQAKL